MTSIDQLNVENIVKNSGSSFYWGMKLYLRLKKEQCSLFMHFVELLMISLTIMEQLNSKKIKLNNWKKKINGLYQKKNK